MELAKLLPRIQHVIRCEKHLSIEMEKSNGCNGNLLKLHLYVIVKYTRAASISWDPDLRAPGTVSNRYCYSTCKPVPRNSQRLQCRCRFPSGVRRYRFRGCRRPTKSCRCRQKTRTWTGSRNTSWRRSCNRWSSIPLHCRVAWEIQRGPPWVLPLSRTHTLEGKFSKSFFSCL
jgi:hypothetical protein